MSYEDKILDKFADMIMPPGTIIAYQGIEAPEGFIVYDHIKIYEDEFPRLYPVLAANLNFNKGADSDGRKWVELPEIEDLCIQMTTDTSQVGKTLEAQLPNITGGFEDRRSDALWPTEGKNPFWSGGLSSETGTLWQIDTNRVGKHNIVTFDASRSASLYSGASLQPKGLNALACIKF